MKKLYTKIKLKIERLEVRKQLGQQRVWLFFLRKSFYRILLNITKFFIILFDSSGDSFALIFQRQGKETTPYSYREFKLYQKKIRILFFELLILLALEIIILRR